jgi:hypothetical protein
MTHDEAKRLADMIGSPYRRRDITEREWHAIAGILGKYKRPAKPPKLADRDFEASRIQRAQHYVAYHVLEWQKAYRLKHSCERVPGGETTNILDNEIAFVVRWMGINPEQISRPAVRTIMRNGPCLRPRFSFARQLATLI